MSTRKGFSLPEVLVSAAIVGILTLTGLMIFQFGNRASRKTDRKIDIFRSGSHAILRVRKHMRGADVVSPTPGNIANEVVYRFPSIVDDRLQVDSTGATEYAGEARIFLKDNKLMLEKPLGSDLQLLATLEDATFEAKADTSFVEFYLRSGPRAEPHLVFERRFRLAK